jgi:hypothetical protein
MLVGLMSECSNQELADLFVRNMAQFCYSTLLNAVVGILPLAAPPIKHVR